VTSFSLIIASIIQWRSTYGLSPVDCLILTMLSYTMTFVGTNIQKYMLTLRQEEGMRSLNLVFLVHNAALTELGDLFLSTVSNFVNGTSWDAT
jgi:hypothetical protein